MPKPFCQLDAATLTDLFVGLNVEQLMVGGDEEAIALWPRGLRPASAAKPRGRTV
jgi:hypothetical protein